RGYALLLTLGRRRWWSLADIGPRIRFFFCIPTPLNRRLVGAINIFVVFLFRIRAVMRISWQSLYVRPLLSGSGSHHQDYAQRRVDGFAQHGAIHRQVAVLAAIRRAAFQARSIIQRLLRRPFMRLSISRARFIKYPSRPSSPAIRNCRPLIVKLTRDIPRGQLYG